MNIIIGLYCKEVSLNELNKFKGTVPVTETHHIVSHTWFKDNRTLFILMLLKSDSPLCTVMDLLSLWDEITWCVNLRQRNTL